MLFLCLQGACDNIDGAWLNHNIAASGMFNWVGPFDYSMLFVYVAERVIG